jgi:hypothetical protein
MRTLFTEVSKVKQDKLSSEKDLQDWREKMGQDLEIFYNRYDDKIRQAGLSDSERKIFEDRFKSTEMAVNQSRETLTLLNVQVG